MRLHDIRHALHDITARPTAVVELTRAPPDCAWYENEAAAGAGRETTPEAIVQRATETCAHRVEIRGGRLLALPQLAALAARCLDEGLETWLRLSGDLDYRGLDPRLRRVVLYKCPGTRLTQHNHPDWLPALGPRDLLCFDILDRYDYEWAKDFLRGRGLACPVRLRGVPGHCPPGAVRDWVLSDDLDVAVQPP